MNEERKTTVTDIFELSKNMADVESASMEARETVREAMSKIGQIVFSSGDSEAMEDWTIIYSYFKMMNGITDDILKMFKKTVEDEEDRIIREGE